MIQVFLTKNHFLPTQHIYRQKCPLALFLLFKKFKIEQGNIGHSSFFLPVNKKTFVNDKHNFFRLNL